MQVFWAQGFSATSLDDLAQATQMNRPSIYNAFGDKASFYRRALAAFSAQLEGQIGEVLFANPTLRDALLAFFYGALDVYFADEPAQGCFVMCTAPVEAVAHPEVREDLRGVIAQIDRALARRFEQAAAQEGWPGGDPRAAARLAQATLHSLAIRARAGESKVALRKMAREAVQLFAGES